MQTEPTTTGNDDEQPEDYDDHIPEQDPDGYRAGDAGDLQPDPSPPPQPGAVQAALARWHGDVAPPVRERVKARSTTSHHTSGFAAALVDGLTRLPRVHSDDLDPEERERRRARNRRQRAARRVTRRAGRR